MGLIIQIAIVSTLSVILTIIAPGLLLNIFRNKIQNTNIVWNMDDGVWVIATGFVFNLLLFLLVYELFHLGWRDQFLLSQLVYSLDVLICVWLYSFYRSELANFLRSLWQFLINPMHALMFSIITIFCVFAIYNYPHTLDSGQLKWTLKLMNFLTLRMADGVNSGAIGFSGLIYFPAQIFTNIPLVTLSAGLKITLGWFLVFAIIYLVEKINFQFRNLFKLILFFVLLESSFAFFGIYQTGKDSILAVLFSVLYLASLFEENEEYDFYIRCGLLLLCSIMAGVITLPYLFIITGIYFIFKLNKLERPLLFLFFLLGISSPGIILVAHAMGKTSYIFSAIVYLAMLVLLYLMRNINFKKIKLSFPLYFIFPVLLVAIFIILHFLMPIKVAIVSTSDALGNPIVSYYSPLDGNTTLMQYLNFNGNMDLFFVKIGLLGMLLFVFSKKYRSMSILYSLSLFSFSVLLLVIFLAHWKHSPFSGFNLWDLSRDITDYYYPFIMGVFSLILLEMIFAKFGAKKSVLQKWLVTTVSTIFILISAASAFGFFAPLNVTFTSIGGDQNKVFAEATYALTKNNLKVDTLFVDKDSSAFIYLYSFQMYTNLVYFPIDFKDADWEQSLALNKAYLILINNKNLTKLTKLAKQKNKSIYCVKNFNGTDSGLYQVSIAHANHLL